ncbi:MAG: hypothetical protein AAF171_21910 [Cyanobacteria bacterium P01_A01_bin.116]
MKLWIKPVTLFLWSLVLVASVLLMPSRADSLTGSRINQLESQVRSLQTQINQLRNASPRLSPGSVTGGSGFPGSESSPNNSSLLPGDPSLEVQFDNLATLVIELNQRVITLEEQIEKRDR